MKMIANTLSDDALSSVARRVLALATSDDALRSEVCVFLGTLGSRQSPPTSFDTSGQPPEETELVLIQRRCRLKVEGSQWAAERMRLQNEGADFRTEIAPFDSTIVERAKLISECNLWMNRSVAPQPSSPQEYEVVGRCFEALAEATSVVIEVLENLSNQKAFLALALQLMAEAQSALRVKIQQIGGPDDHDQIAAYIWLRETATAHGVVVERFVLMDDPADPDDWDDLLSRIESFRQSVAHAKRRELRKSVLVGTLKTLSDHLLLCGAEERHRPWQQISDTLDELLSQGVPPSDLAVREAILPVIDDMPKMRDEPKSLQLVQRELDRVRERPDPEAERPRTVAPISPEVQQVVPLLSGKTVVLIGGDCRPERKKALEEAFGLKELVWVETTPGQSVNSFAPYVARPEVTVVLLAIRWVSHSHCNVQRFCDRYHKPLVWLPAGYGANQVAMQILAQCSDRLWGT